MSILNIIPIPKKGDINLGSNYRGISLTSLVAKTYNRMILNRIRPHLDCYLRKNQNGFRSGRTTTSQILALRRLIEGVKDKNLEAIMIFIDFKKAFDTIYRGKMLAILKAYGIPDELLWEPTHGTRRQGRPPDSYIRNLERKTGIPESEMRVAMMNRDVWRTFTVRETTIPK